MNNIKNIAKGFVLLSFLVGAVIASPAQAENSNENESTKAFLNANASLKADVLGKIENSLGVVLGPNGALRVMGAKVTSVSGSNINATASFGNSSLSFVIKTDAETKLNGKAFANSSSLASLKAGDKISFAGVITSSSSSSLTVDASHVVSQNLYKDGKIENKDSFKGEVKAVNTADNSFTLKLKSGVTVKVNVSSSTVITLDGATATLASLKAGDEVKITGEINADGSVITASKVSAESEDADDNDDDEDSDEDKDKDENKNENKGGFWGKIRNWFWK
jgi:hypothetical protein